MLQTAALKTLIRGRAILKNQREREQGNLINENDLHHETIRAKLSGRFETTQMDNFSKCGREQIFRTCKCCGQVEQFSYRCSLKWCPRCQWIITERRRQVLAKWAKRITQPKHLVLTQRNFRHLTRTVLRTHQKNLAAIRRTKCWKTVRGGSVSIEITNEQRGWHLHSHWLLDVRWLDMTEISTTWAHLVGQEFSIVKIKDCRDQEYLQEVSKYVVEGSELAKWPAEEVNEFVRAIRGRRFFFAFGSLFKAGREIRAEIRAEKPVRQACECGANDFTFETEEQTALNEIRQLCRKKRH
jgi:hypothetical protein